MSKVILVCGLPGSGKTYFSERLKAALGDCAVHINGDDIRKAHNDWDFSEEGRLRQAKRMKAVADAGKENGMHVILDFVCPKKEYRDLIKPDILVWANRTPVRDFPDTTAMFQPPADYDYELHDDVDVEWIVELVVEAATRFEYTEPSALMIGRFQPFHAGHKALFEKALEKHGQVCIAIRSMPSSGSNPFNAYEVEERIHEALKEYSGKYETFIFPNVVDVVYGRDVGWTVSKIDLPPEIEAISATQIRAQMQK